MHPGHALARVGGTALELLHGSRPVVGTHGLILRNDSRGDPTTQLCPPLVITREECDRVVDVLEQTFNELGQKIGTVGTSFPAG